MGLFDLFFGSGGDKNSSSSTNNANTSKNKQQPQVATATTATSVVPYADVESLPVAVAVSIDSNDPYYVPQPAVNPDYHAVHPVSPQSQTVHQNQQQLQQQSNTPSSSCPHFLPPAIRPAVSTGSAPQRPVLQQQTQQNPGWIPQILHQPVQQQLQQYVPHQILPQQQQQQQSMTTTTTTTTFLHHPDLPSILAQLPRHTTLLPQCPVCCRANVRTRIRTAPNWITWVSCVILFFVCWPVCWIPLVSDCMKVTEHYCTNCQQQVGQVAPYQDCCVKHRS